MFANNPLAMVRHREMQTAALVRDAVAYRRASDALRGRVRRVEPWPAPPAEAPHRHEVASRVRRRAMATASS